jgi:hypothetical protein
MRTVLAIGATICFVIGLYCLYDLAWGIVKLWPDFLYVPRLPVYCFFCTVFLILAFAPIIMLIRARKLEKRHSRFIAIGVIEVIVIGLFLAMLFPAL